MPTLRIGVLGFHKGAGRHYYRCNGSMKYLPKGLTQEQAEEEYRKVKIQLGLDEANRPVHVDDVPISDIVDMYLADRAKTYPETAAKVGVPLRRFAAAVGDKTPASILPYAVKQFVDTYPTRTTGSGKRQVLRQVAAMFNWCCRYKGGQRKPHLGLVYDTPVRGEEYVVEPADWVKMRPLIPQPFRDLCDVMWQSGCRPGEAIKARIEWYVAESKMILIPKELNKKAKRKKPRKILLNSATAAIVEASIGGRKAGPIFDMHMRIDSAEAAICLHLREAAAAVGRPGPVIGYSLRHSAAVRWLEGEVPIHDVAAWLGNTVGVCEKHYAHTLARAESKGRRPD